MYDAATSSVRWGTSLWYFLFRRKFESGRLQLISNYSRFFTRATKCHRKTPSEIRDPPLRDLLTSATCCPNSSDRLLPSSGRSADYIRDHGGGPSTALTSDQSTDCQRGRGREDKPPLPRGTQQSISAHRPFLHIAVENHIYGEKDVKKFGTQRRMENDETGQLHA